jgi:uncharacterized protein YdaL
MGLIALALWLASATGTHAAQQALIVFDGGAYRFYGDTFAQCVRNLLSHFDYEAVSKPVEQYAAGEVNNYDALFYIGTDYDHPLPEPFIADVIATDTTVCWIGYNIWRAAMIAPDLAEDNPDFVARTGFRFVGYGNGYEKVHYKGEDLNKDLADDGLSLVEVVDATRAQVYATASTALGEETPYIIKGGHIWSIGDNPCSAITASDRYFAFCDVLHDILNVQHEESHRALVRLEDVSAITGAAILRQYADFAASRSVPFMISVIPEFRDPRNIFSKVTLATLDTHPEFAQAMAYCESKGGRLLVHGLTHQYLAEINPISAVSGVDYEFYTVVVVPGGQDATGPVPLDSAFWARKRLDRAKGYFTRNGLTPFGWNTPHYLASAVDYREIARQFPLVTDRCVLFGKRPDGSLEFTQQPFPFVIPRDVYGIKRVPESIGYIDPYGSPPSLAADLAARARGLKVVRDGIASFYFHPFLDINLLDQAITAIEAEGYTFVDPATL